MNAGAIPCTRMSQAAYTINIPGELLFCMNENFLIPAELHLQNTQYPFPLNLYHLQQAIFRGYRKMWRMVSFLKCLITKHIMETIVSCLKISLRISSGTCIQEIPRNLIFAIHYEHRFVLS